MYIAVMIVLVAALGLMGWGIIGRQTRGRPRCRGCWYDMSGLDTLTCPECGRVARSDRALLRARCRWWAVAVGAVLFAVGCFGLRVTNVGLDAALPAAAHVALYDRRPASEAELRLRMVEARLSAWAWRRLVRRNARALERESDAARLIRELRLLDTIMETTQRPNRPRFSRDELGDAYAIDLTPTVPGLEGLLTHRDPRVSDQAWRHLRDISPSTARHHAVDQFIRDLPTSTMRLGPDRLRLSEVTLLLNVRIAAWSPPEHWGDAVASRFVQTVRRCTSMAELRPHLIEGLDSESEVVRKCSLALLFAADELDDAARDRVIDFLDEESRMLRYSAQQISLEFPIDPRLMTAVDRALDDGDAFDRRWAAQFVATRGPAKWRERAQGSPLLPPHPITPDVLDQIPVGRQQLAPDAKMAHGLLSGYMESAVRDANTLIELGVPRDEIADRLLATVDERIPLDGDPVPDRFALPSTTWHDLHVAHTMNVLTTLESNHARKLAEARLLAPSPSVRLAAGCALLRFDGDLDRATGLIIDASIAMGRDELPRTAVADFRRRGLALRMVTPLLADGRPSVRLLGVRMLAAAGPDHAGDAEPHLHELLRSAPAPGIATPKWPPSFTADWRSAAIQTLNGFILDD